MRAGSESNGRSRRRHLHSGLSQRAEPVVFLLARYPDVIANDPSIVFNNGCERPLGAKLDPLDDVDPVRVLLRSRHIVQAS
jgi:hypothetical protein